MPATDDDAGRRQAELPPAAPVDVAFGAGRVLRIRPVEPADEAGLVALYDGLDPDDRVRRFFCSYRPRPAWFTDLTRPELHNGARFVAELVADGASTIVGEAGYVGLADGNGELALLVDRRWRGWLGPYLLDLLVDEAAQRGVPNLEADVLLQNRPMLTLLRRRGAVAVDHDGFSTIRVRIGTAGLPTWDGTPSGARTLVETPGGRWDGEAAATAAGRSVLTCFGPESNPRCPVLAGHTCPLAAGADQVIVRAPRGREAWNRLVAAHRELHPDVALLLEELLPPR